MPLKNADFRKWGDIKPSWDGRKYSTYPRGDKPGGGGGGSGYSIDFTSASVQDPLSDGGNWSCDTVGVGGNTAPNILSNMRVALDFAADVNGAFGDALGQDSPHDYRDSFAFVPGVSGSSGDFAVTTTIYIEPGYDPQTGGGAHELEIIIGCRTYIDGSARGCHRWIECNLNTAGGCDFISLGSGAAGDYPGANNDFSVFGSQVATVVPTDGVEFKVTKVGNLYRAYVGGTLVNTVTSTQTGLGNGAGIAAFWRTTHGENPLKYGFRTFTCTGS